MREEVKQVLSIELTEEEEELLCRKIRLATWSKDRRNIAPAMAIYRDAGHKAELYYRGKYINLASHFGTTSPLFMAVAFAVKYKDKHTRAGTQFSDLPRVVNGNRFIPIQHEGYFALFLIAALMVIELGFCYITVRALKEMCSALYRDYSKKFVTMACKRMVNMSYLKVIGNNVVKERGKKYPKKPVVKGGKTRRFILDNTGYVYYRELNNQIYSITDKVRKL